MFDIENYSGAKVLKSVKSILTMNSGKAVLKSVAVHVSKKGNYGVKFIFANCFYPVIQCHLPKTFHLRHTFPYVMKALGLRFVGSVDGAAHALVFERAAPLSLSNARRAETASRLIGPLLNHTRGLLRALIAFTLK